MDRRQFLKRAGLLVSGAVAMPLAGLRFTAEDSAAKVVKELEAASIPEIWHDEAIRAKFFAEDVRNELAKRERVVGTPRKIEVLWSDPTLDFPVLRGVVQKGKKAKFFKAMYSPDIGSDAVLRGRFIEDLAENIQAAWRKVA